MYGITHLQIVLTLPRIQLFNVTWKQVLHILSLILLSPSHIRISTVAEFLRKYILRYFFLMTGQYSLALWNLSTHKSWRLAVLNSLSFSSSYKIEFLESASEFNCPHMLGTVPREAPCAEMLSPNECWHWCLPGGRNRKMSLPPTPCKQFTESSSNHKCKHFQTGN